MECRAMRSKKVLLFFIASLLNTANASYTAGRWLYAGSNCFFFSKHVSANPWGRSCSLCPFDYFRMAEPTSDKEMSFLGEAGNAVYGESGVKWAIGVKVNQQNRSLYYQSGQSHSFIEDLRKYWRGSPLSDVPSQRMCVYLQNKQLYDANCSLAMYFICETPLPKSCSSSPCLNGAKCTEGCSGIYCACPTDHYGQRCEYSHNQCASRPCQNNGRCTDLIAAYKCDCNEGSTGVNCEHTIPNALHYNCSDWLPESQNITCECRVDGLDSKHLVGWNLFGNNTDLRPTIFFDSVKRNANLTEYICQMTQVTPNVANPVVKKITYRPRIAYGPTRVYVEGPVIVFSNCDTDNLTLNCRSDHVEPYAVASWAGVKCLDGNDLRVCRLLPSLESVAVLKDGRLIEVNCTLTNGESSQLHASSEVFTIHITCTRHAKIAYLAVEGVRNELAANTTNQRLKLVCSAIGANGLKRLDVYLVAGRNSSATEGGDLLTPNKTSNISEYKLEKEYIVRSPAACQAVDTYRCETSDMKEINTTDAGHVTIVSNCPRVSFARTATSPSVIAGSVAGALSALAGVALTVYAVRRQKTNAAERRGEGASGEAATQQQSEMFTEHLQDATRTGEAQHEQEGGAERVSENHDGGMLKDSFAAATTYDPNTLEESAGSITSTAV
ncbi:hypothetical protein BaRGS_00038748 [Batillaria attramentaria]|uniref:Uncharacterized protein n=1 Tax=Batillaria attramentaria TaxID=370345 RepID=A0ABD0J568_9CAEN